MPCYATPRNGMLPYTVLPLEVIHDSLSAWKQTKIIEERRREKGREGEGRILENRRLLQKGEGRGEQTCTAHHMFVSR